MTESCETCRFRREKKNRHECRKNAPLAVMIPQLMEAPRVYSFCPDVTLDFWCSEYEEQETTS